MSLWIKLWTEILSDDKFNALPEKSQLLALKLFLIAGLHEDPILPPDSGLAWLLHTTPAGLARLLEPLMTCGIVTRNGGGLLHVTNFEKRQARVSNAEKQRGYRERYQSVTNPLPIRYQSVTESNTEVTDSVTRALPKALPNRIEQNRIEGEQTPAQLYEMALGNVVGPSHFKKIEMAEITNLEKWQEVIDEWLTRGYKVGNLTGMLDWYRDGIPPKNSRPPAPEVRGDPMTGGIRR